MVMMVAADRVCALIFDIFPTFLPSLTVSVRGQFFITFSEDSCIHAIAFPITTLFTFGFLIFRDILRGGH